MPDENPKTAEHVTVCPHCGYCPTCGRANALPAVPAPVLPYRPWPWVYPYSWHGVVPPPGLTWPVVVNRTTGPTPRETSVYIDTTGVGFSAFTNTDAH